MNLEIWKDWTDWIRDLTRRGTRFAGAGGYPVRYARQAATGDENINFNSRFGIQNLRKIKKSEKINTTWYPKPLKSDPLGCLGGVWRPFWSQEGPEELNYKKILDFFKDLGVIWGTKNGTEIVKKTVLKLIHFL